LRFWYIIKTLCTILIPLCAFAPLARAGPLGSYNEIIIDLSLFGHQSHPHILFIYPHFSSLPRTNSTFTFDSALSVTTEVRPPTTHLGFHNKTQLRFHHPFLHRQSGHSSGGDNQTGTDLSRSRIKHTDSKDKKTQRQTKRHRDKQKDTETNRDYETKTKDKQNARSRPRINKT